MLATILVLYIDLFTRIKVPGYYMAINSKSQIGYELMLVDFKRIIIIYEKPPLDVQMFTIELEPTLEKYMAKVFPKIGHIDCSFNYVECFVRWQ